jgi:hypothetical protein
MAFDQFLVVQRPWRSAHHHSLTNGYLAEEYMIHSLTRGDFDESDAGYCRAEQMPDQMAFRHGAQGGEMC